MDRHPPPGPEDPSGPGRRRRSFIGSSWRPTGSDGAGGGECAGRTGTRSADRRPKRRLLL